MATKKRKKKSTRRRRRSVSGMKLSPPVVQYAAPAVTAAGGLLGGKWLAEQIEKVNKGKMNGKLMGGLSIGLGLVLVFVKFGKKKTIWETAPGGVLVGFGIWKLLVEFGVINGIGGFKQVPVVAGTSRSRMNGFKQVPVVAGMGSYNPNPGPNSLGQYQVPKPIHSQIMGCIDEAQSSAFR